MIPRRILAHLRRQNWTAVAIDFVIVVAGVFVGIQASNLNSDRLDRQHEREYLDRLSTDLDAIIANAQSQMDFEVNKSREVSASLTLSKMPPTEEKAEKLGQALTVISARFSPNFESPTFNDLQNSGSLSLIENSTLRRDLSAYFARLQYLRGVIGRNNDHYAEPFVDYLRNQDIAAGFTDVDYAAGVPLSQLEKNIAGFSIKRFGGRGAASPDSKLRLPMSAPFWASLRSQLTWRGQGAIANENLLNMIVADARRMKAEVQTY